jgi:Cu/Ag efflux protein CusF
MTNVKANPQDLGSRRFSPTRKALLKGRNVLLPFLILVLALSVGCSKKTETAGKTYRFHGTVVSVDASSKLANIKGDKVDGWMEAMTMDYPVPDSTDLTKLKPGLEFNATLTVTGDSYSLHDVKPAPKAGSQ